MLMELTIHIIDQNVKDSIKDFIALKIGLHSSAINVNIVKDIPKNSSGKTQYSQL